MHMRSWLWLRRDSLIAVAGASLLWRRIEPIPALLGCWLALFGLAIFVPSFDNTSTTLAVAYFVSIFSLGTHTRGRREVPASVLLVLIGVVTFGVTDGDAFSVGNITFATFFAGGPWATGLALRLRGDLALANERLKVEHEEQTRRAVAAERATIARELHDVVAHAISVTLLQARGARRMLGRDDQQVRRSLDAIEHTNTQALGDMRQLLALLRDIEGDTAHTPQPSLARLADLVADVEESGLPVLVETTGESDAIPPGVDLSAYQIIQEALTNVLKHAGPATATVSLTFGADDLTLAVTDTDTGCGGHINGTGHGLVGIRERVAVVGGEVTAGQSPDGGFAVRARLPYSLEA